MRVHIFIISITLLMFSASHPTAVQAENVGDMFFKNDRQYQDVIVQKVIQADTITIKNHMQKGEKIRLIGLKAPEPPKHKIERDDQGIIIKEIDPTSTIEEQAMVFAKDLLEGQHVRLEFDREKKDPDFVTWAYVFLIEDDVFANTEILRQGFSDLHIVQPNTKYAKELRAAYREARKEKRGLQNR